MQLDPEFLSRIHFMWVIGWHPAAGIHAQRGSLVGVREGAFALTRRPVFLYVLLFWLPILAISLGVGVVTGIVMAASPSRQALLLIGTFSAGGSMLRARWPHRVFRGKVRSDIVYD